MIPTSDGGLIAAGYSDDDDTLGGRICRAREALGLSTEALAQRLGVDLSTLENWELDQDEPRSNRLVMLAGILEVSPGWLLSGAGESPTETVRSADVALLVATLNDLKQKHDAMGQQIDELLARLEHYGGAN